MAGVPVIVDYTISIADPEREISTVRAHRRYADSDATDLTQLIADRDGLCTAVAGVTGGLVQKCQVSLTNYMNFALPSFASTSYGNSEDKMFLVFREPVGGGKYTVQVPAPLLTDFGSDTETVNPTDTNVAALIAEITGNFTTKDGNGNLTFTVGYRRRSKSRKERPGVATAQG